MTKDMLSISEVIEKSTSFLAARGINSPKCDSEWIISFVLGSSRLELFLNFDKPLDKEALERIKRLIILRGTRVPLQHILGNVQFAGITLNCDNRALIPRPETEQLVEILIDLLPTSFRGHIVDLGTGSGAIILSLCSALKESTGIGLDKSYDAISLAKENLFLNGLEKQVKIGLFDWNTDPLPRMNIDLIVSNPPYLNIEEWKTAEKEVREHDPYDALVSPNGGLQDLLTIATKSTEILKRGSLLAFEVGAAQALHVKNCLLGEFDVDIINDYHQCPRFIIARKT